MSFASVGEISSRARTCVKYEALVVFPVWLHPVSDQMILRFYVPSSPARVFQSSLSTLDRPLAPVAPLKAPFPLTQPNRKNKLDPSDSQRFLWRSDPRIRRLSVAAFFIPRISAECLPRWRGRVSAGLRGVDARSISHFLIHLSFCLSNSLLGG